MENELRSLLVAGGVLSAEAVNWAVHPQGQEYPGVVLTTIDDFGGHTLDGPTRLRSARVQTDVYAPTRVAAKEIADQIEALLDGHTDSRFQGIFLLSRSFKRDGTDHELLFRTSLDWDVRWNKS